MGEGREEKGEGGIGALGFWEDIFFKPDYLNAAGWRARGRSGKGNAFLEQIFERLGLLGGYI
jgi:hypothetical protein